MSLEAGSERRCKTDTRSMILKVSTLRPQAVLEWKSKKQVVNQSMNHDCQQRRLFLAKARSFPNARDIPTANSQQGNKWNPAGLTVQALLAAQCTVIETFISPLVVREGMSINGAHSHHWNLERPQQFWAAFHLLASGVCQGQRRLKSKLKEVFLYPNLQLR